MESTITFDELPTEMKIFIFSFFRDGELNCTVAKICKKWRCLCSDPLLWRRVFSGGRESSEIVQVLNRNHFVKRINFGIISEFNWIDHVVRHKSVRSLEIWNCKFTKSFLSRLINIFPNVEQIQLDQCNYVNEAIFEVTNWKLLKSITLDGKSDASDNDIISAYIPLLAKRIQCLEEIKLKLFLTIKNRDFRRLIETQGVNLKYISGIFSEVDEESYKEMAIRCVNLKYLCLWNPRLITDSILFMLLKNLPSFKILKIECMYDNELFANDFTSIFANATFPFIVKLKLSGGDTCVRDKHLKTFLKCFPLLKNFHINWSRIITDEGLRIVPTACPVLERFTIKNVHLVTEECVIQIASQLPKLRYCSAYWCPLIKDGGLYEIGNKYASKVYNK